ncbi:MAG: triphosphoribosyl-dephospho-CoA synthase [Planctomycetota bacterium]
MTLSAPRFHAAFARAAAALPAALAPRGRGWCLAVAGILEAAAAKPGNVHPAASFPDLTFANLVAAGIAAGRALDAAATRPLGETILRAVRATAAATPSNANLGIVLVVAPLAAAPGAPVGPTPMSAAAADAIVAAAGPADAAAIWEAIHIAKPGGLGRSENWDVFGPPPTDIRTAMRESADRDTIARLWSQGYDELFTGPVADLAEAIAAGWPLEPAIIRCHLRQLARCPDSLIGRRHGPAAAKEVTARAAALVAREPAAPVAAAAPEWLAAIADFDASLRTPRRLNPGTTADLVAAALYILLRDGRLAAPLDAAIPPTQTP